LRAFSDAGSTPAASTTLKLFIRSFPANRVWDAGHGAHPGIVAENDRVKFAQEDALRLGADHAGSLDFILDAVSAGHDINAHINLPGHDGAC